MNSLLLLVTFSAIRIASGNNPAHDDNSFYDYNFHHDDNNNNNNYNTFAHNEETSHTKR